MKKLNKAFPLLGLFIVFINCKNDDSFKKNNDHKMTYEIGYYNRDFARIIIFDNNDTIYFSNDYSKSIDQYDKVESDEETLVIIKKIIADDIKSKSLLIMRDYTTDSGKLILKITCGSNEMKRERRGVGRELKVSNNFSRLLNLLREKHNNVYKIFMTE